MRIVIDLQGAQTESRFRGIGRYSLSLALAIARNAGEHEIWLVLNSAFTQSILDIRFAFKDFLPQNRICVFDVSLPVAEINQDNHLRARIAESIRECFLQQLNPDVILITSLFEGFVDDAVTSIGTFYSSEKTAVILYDLIPYLNSQLYLPSQEQQDYYFRKIESLKRANLLLSISEYSKQEAVNALGLSNEAVVNISTAVGEEFYPISLSSGDTQMFLEKLGIKRQFIMYAPGGFDARKNFDGLIKAYAQLTKEAREAHQLVIVSKIQEVERANLLAIAKYEGLQQDELILTGYVTDKDLIALYSLTKLFVFPSKHEGFGLPVLEAMSCGAPVIGSNTTSIPEVVGLEEALFNPNNPLDIALKIEQVLKDDAFRSRLIEHAKQQSQEFSWDESAKKVIVTLENRVKKLPVIESLSIDAQYARLIDQTAHLINNSNMGIADFDLLSIAKTIANNQKHENINLFIDISEIVNRDAKSGIQRVVRSILLELLNLTFDGICVSPIYFDGKKYRLAHIFTQKFRNISPQAGEDSVVDFGSGDIYLALDLNAHLTNAVHDIHVKLNALGVNLYFIVYDILLVQHPEWWPEGTSAVFENWLRSISELSTGLICISDAVAQEVRQWLLENKPNRHGFPDINSFHLGADVDSSMPTTGLPIGFDNVVNKIKASPSFLTVGTIEPRKGHAQLLNAFELLWADGFDVNLIIIGKKGWLVDGLMQQLEQHPELDKKLILLEAVSDQALMVVYQQASCLVAASEGEGFGLPLIEAAQHKLPIIARDIPVFREVAGEYAYYFDNTKDVEVLAKSIKWWLEMFKQDKHPKSDDMPWLTWKQSSESLLNIMLNNYG